MAQGYDGFTAMKGRKFIIDDENGQIMSSIIRSFLLGESPGSLAATRLIIRLILYLPTRPITRRSPNASIEKDRQGHLSRSIKTSVKRLTISAVIRCFLASIS